MSNLAVVLQSDMSRASVELHQLRTNLTELQLKFSNSMEQSANTVEHLYNGVCIFIRKHTLENPEDAIKNGKSRETGNIWNTRRRKHNKNKTPLYSIKHR